MSLFEKNLFATSDMPFDKATQFSRIARIKKVVDEDKSASCTIIERRLILIPSSK